MPSATLALSVTRHLSYAAGNHTQHVREAEQKVFKYFSGTFDHGLYKKYTGLLNEESRAGAMYESYSRGSTKPHCDKGDTTPEVIRTNTDGGAFPGGITMVPSFSKLISDLATKSSGGGGATCMPLTMGLLALQTGMGLVQNIAGALIHIVPPLIPPPVWINMPLPCAPMVTGVNCFGAVLYPITMVDFLLADMTDKVMESYLASFPDTYAAKVGQTSDEMYKVCAASYFTLHCSAIFPRCTTPFSREEAIPVGGRVPVCLHLCVLPLVLCPGFWVDDVFGSCEFVSVPPMCTMGFFWNLWKVPPQYRSYDEANPFPADCPDEEENGIDASGQISLYDDVNVQISPIIRSAAALSGSGSINEPSLLPGSPLK